MQLNIHHRTGVADEELAKRAAERSRKLALEADDEDVAEDSKATRRRSVSSDSVSSISTRSRSPASPAPPRHRTTSPEVVVPAQTRRSASSRSWSSRSRSRSRSVDSASQGGRRSPPPRQSGRDSRPRSPPVRERRRDDSLGRDRRPAHAKSRMESSDFFGASAPREARRRDSRSPERETIRSRDDRGGSEARRYRDREEGYEGREKRDTRSPQKRGSRRERSMSPFSKRLALTQAMKPSR